jgi:hypothetical protein
MAQRPFAAALFRPAAPGKLAPLPLPPSAIGRAVTFRGHCSLGPHSRFNILPPTQLTSVGDQLLDYFNWFACMLLLNPLRKYE